MITPYNCGYCTYAVEDASLLRSHVMGSHPESSSLGINQLAQSFKQHKVANTEEVIKSLHQHSFTVVVMWEYEHHENGSGIAYKRATVLRCSTCPEEVTR